MLGCRALRKRAVISAVTHRMKSAIFAVPRGRRASVAGIPKRQPFLGADRVPRFEGNGSVDLVKMEISVI
jgi:hypothetical protein